MEINYDPNSIVTPLSVEELTVLLNLPIKKIAKDKDFLELILRRSLVTSQTLKNARIEFDNELRRRSAMIPASGGATSMANPELAVRYLPPEEISKLFDKLSQEKLEYLENQITKTVNERERARRVIEQIAALAYREGLDPVVANELIALLKESKEV